MRDEFANATKTTLAKRVGYRCSNPQCRQPTVGPSSDPASSINLGVAAHITAATEGGPRYDLELTAEERKSPENGIWLCQKCAKLIDTDVNQFPVSVLQSWKSDSENLARELLDQTTAIARDIESTIENTSDRAGYIQSYLKMLDLLAIYSGGLGVVLKEAHTFGPQQELAERTFRAVISIIEKENPQSVHLNDLKKYEERLKTI